LGHCRQNCHGDIRSGEQTILDYLIQPPNRAKEARVSSHAKYL